ncbi:flagellar biosynthesis protein FlhB [Limnobacter sp.]|uniref:EscU/YscU/HrcU family type III secretion system export apparatus switch protein n=1 Tax=Limnobacter sp. TaxID=2003368 RepID=UPI003510E2E2
MSGEKTEKPTQKKIDDARKKGQVAVSKDAQIVLKLGTFYAFLFWVGGSYIEYFSELLDLIINAGAVADKARGQEITDMALKVLLLITLPLVFVCAVMGLLATWMQIGFLVAPEGATPSLKKMNAIGNIKNMLSKKSLVQLMLSVVKVCILVGLGYLVFIGNLPEMLYSFRVGVPQFLDVLMLILKQLVMYSLAVFVILALIDWTMEKAHLTKQLMMSHQDIKDEYKQREGDPRLKQKRKSMHRSLLNASLNKVGGAKAVVANPTHISVALDYEPGKHDLPYIVCMGVDEDAMLIREEAKKHGVPIVTNVKLARMLYQDCDEEQYIRKQHLQLAAEVFRTVMELQLRQSNMSQN